MARHLNILADARMRQEEAPPSPPLAPPSPPSPNETGPYNPASAHDIPPVEEGSDVARVASRMRRLDFVERAVECFIDFNECVTKLDDIMRPGAHNTFAVSNMKRLEELNHIVLRFLLTDVENLPPGDASILARLRQRGFVQERPPLESVRRSLRERAKRLLQALHNAAAL